VLHWSGSRGRVHTGEVKSIPVISVAERSAT
jgi:hypothetical protein